MLGFNASPRGEARAHQEHGNADLQKDPDDDDDIAVDENSHDHVERAVVRVYGDEAVELGGW